MNRKIGSYLTCVVIGLALALSGCAGKEQATVRDELTRAEEMLKAAEMIGGDTYAPAEMAKARRELLQAGRLINREPQTGRLSLNLLQKSDDTKKTAESVRAAISETELVLARVKAELSEAENREATVNDLAPEALAELQASIQEELSVGLRQEIESEVRRDNQQHLDTVAAELRDYRNEARLATAKLENIRQSMGADRSELYSALSREFGNDLAGWGAEIDQETLAIRFIGPATAFKNASTWVNRSLRRILEDFFPRLEKVLNQPEYKSRIEKIMVVGFASTTYKAAKNTSERHRLNMVLSKERAANVVNFLAQQPTLQGEWLKNQLVAAGMSDKQPVFTAGGTENQQQSRRIEIRIIMADNIG